MPSQSENCASALPLDPLPMCKQKDHYKVVVMGSAKVGKTALINQFLFDRFDTKYKETVEELYRGEYDISGSSLVLEILDTSGAYQFPAMRALSIAKADAFILVYAINDSESFEEVRRLREDIVRTKGDKIPIVVVGNKSDVGEEHRKVSRETAETIVNIDWENGFVEASAKNNSMVVRVFKELLIQGNVQYALSPAVKRRRQSLPNGGRLQQPASPMSLSRRLSKRHSCVIS